MKDYYIRAMDSQGRLRIFVGTSTHLVEEARRIHNTSPTATAALGRVLTAGLLMGAMMKNEDDILTLKIAGDGPAGEILVVAKNNGNIKGDITNPHADLPLKSNGKLDVGGLVGRNGNLVTMMDLGLKETYIGQSELVTGEIAEDLANYYAYSEQQASAVSLGVLIDRDRSVKAAGGYIIQLLPGISDEDIDKIEELISDSKPISSLIDQGLSPEEIMEEILQGFSMEILEKKSSQYKCDCSREKIKKVIKQLGQDEIKSMIEEDGQAEITCHFCNSKYLFLEDELREILVDF